MSMLRKIPWRILPAWLRGNRLRIAMYHSIADNPRDPHAVSPVAFKRQMQAMQTERVVSLDEALRLLHLPQSLKNIRVITFDDSLADFYTTALPILRDFGYPVTMFVPTGLVGTNATWDSYDKSKSLMGWDELEKCQQWRVSFGSHTVNHLRLVDCAESTLIDELQTSYLTLSARLEHVLPALAYPGGYHNPRIRAAAQAAGYTCALGAASRWGNGPESDVFQLRRERVPA